MMVARNSGGPRKRDTLKHPAATSMGLLASLHLFLHVVISIMPAALAQSSSACVAKCPYETLTNWTFIPYTDSYGPGGTSCDYYAPCRSMGYGYHVCSYYVSIHALCAYIPPSSSRHHLQPNGTLFPSEYGEICDVPYTEEMCPSTTRVICPPPAGVTCNATCPATDISGTPLSLADTTSGDFAIICGYGETIIGGSAPISCVYYPVSSSSLPEKAYGLMEDAGRWRVRV